MSNKCRFTLVLLCIVLFISVTGCSSDKGSSAAAAPSPTAAGRAASGQTDSPAETIYIPAKHNYYSYIYDTALPVPAPKASIAVSGIPVCRDGAGIFYKGVRESDLDSYLTMLQNEGFELFRHPDEVNVDYIDCWLVRGNETIYILDQTDAEIDGWTPYICIVYDAGYQGTDTAGRISNEEAKKLIQKYIYEMSAENPVNYPSYSAECLAELDTGDAFKKMGLQAYHVFGENESKKYYIVCNGSVAETDYSGYCDVRLGKYITADIDKDGEYEFLLISIGDTGLPSYIISAYKYGIPLASGSTDKKLYRAYRSDYLFPYYNDQVFMDIEFVRISDTEIHLYNTYDYEITSIEDYGVLQMNGNKLIVNERNTS